MYGLLVRGSRDLRGQPRAAQTAAFDAAATQRRRARNRVLYAEYDAAMRRIAEGGQQLYAHWIETVEPGLFPGSAADGTTAGPCISIVMPVHNPPESFLREAIESVTRQHYPNWELCIADDASDPERVRAVIEACRAADERIKVSYLERHGHISRASNCALGMASGEYVTFLDHDDLLSPHALAEMAAALHERPDLDILYSDEDFLDPGGRRCSPHFKSDWNPYLLYSHNYVTHLCLYRRDLVERAGGLREGLEGAQDYDLLLRCSRLTDPARIHHIPKILYHWRMAPTSTALHADRKGYSDAAGRRALQDHFAALGEKVRVDSAGSENFYRVRFERTGPAPLVSLVVPTRDQVALLRRCVDGLLNRTAYSPREVLIVDNRSEEPETLEYLDEIARHPAVRVLRFDEPFNFARICNLGVEQARGEVVGLVNNDVDVIDPGWLDEMAMLAERPEVGCVGAKLLYADDTVQHAGVILGLGGYAAHSHRCYTRDSDGYFNRLKVRQNLSAVTAACLLMRRAVYREVGGMDERLAVAYNDVDLGLQVRQAGYLNVFTPFAELYHLESKTRGYEDTPEKQARFQREKDYLARKWGDAIRLDPYYNPNLTHSREDFTLAL
jgi:GT2 family glycosyltransferase